MVRVNEDDLEDIGWVGNGESLMGFEGKPFTGIATIMHPNGQLEWETMFHDGVRDGWEKKYDEKGNLIYFGQLREARYHGRCIKNYSNGGIKSDAFYEMGFLMKKKEYDENGNLINDYSIENDPKQLKSYKNEMKAAIACKFYKTFYNDDGSLVVKE